MRSAIQRRQDAERSDGKVQPGAGWFYPGTAEEAVPLGGGGGCGAVAEICGRRVFRVGAGRKGGVLGDLPHGVGGVPPPSEQVRNPAGVFGGSGHQRDYGERAGKYFCGEEPKGAGGGQRVHFGGGAGGGDSHAGVGCAPGD